MTKAKSNLPVILTTLALLGALIAPNAWAARDQIINSFASPTATPVGLTYGGGELFTSDLLTKTIYRMNPDNGSVLGSYIPSPTPAGNFMYGLAYNSGYLWCATGSPTRLFQMTPADGSIVASYAAFGVQDGNGIAAYGAYIYLANNKSTAVYIYKFYPDTGSLVTSWAGAKYPGGLTTIKHVPTSKEVVLNLGNVDGWVYIYDLNGTRHEGEQFKIDAPCPETYFTGDLACRDDTHIFFASGYLQTIYEHKINWGGQEEFAVAPTSFGKVKALFR